MAKDGKNSKLNEMIDLLSKKLNEHGLTELKVKADDLSVMVSKQQTVIAGGAAPAVAGSAPTAAAPKASGGHTEKSPMVGVVYLAPEPGADNYIEVGQAVKKGDTICLIEAMKTFNPVKASKDGTIQEILVEGEQMVEFDTPLVVIG